MGMKTATQLTNTQRRSTFVKRPHVKSLYRWQERLKNARCFLMGKNVLLYISIVDQSRSTFINGCQFML